MQIVDVPSSWIIGTFTVTIDATTVTNNNDIRYSFKDDDMNAWMVENVVGGFILDIERAHVRFENEQDAVMFKLAWIG